MLRVVSLFAGIGGFDLGFHRAGLQTVATVERDKNCRALLAKKFPTSEAFEDVTTVGARNLPACDVLCGGWPCQDLSVAGKRAGLQGSRSGLFYEFLRIADELQPAFIVWENVPGLLSSDEGRDFARVLLSLGECGYFGATRIFDVQYFGLAQRRRRVIGVFARADIGAGRCAEILSLGEGMRGHPAPRRETWKRVAGSISARTQGGGGLGTDFELDGGLVGTLTPGAHPGGYNGRDVEQGMLIARAVATRTHRFEPSQEPLMTHSLRGEGFDASEDGTGRGTPIIAFSSKDHGADAGELSPTLRAMQFADSHLNGGGQVAVAIPIQEIGKRESGTPMNGVSHGKDGDPMFTLQRAAVHGVAIGSFKPNQSAKSRSLGFSESLSPTLEGAEGGNNKPALLEGMGVRRLTPRECERLQGFPDDWTAGFADSVRYRMLGNAVPPVFIEWIGKRLVATT